MNKLLQRVFVNMIYPLLVADPTPIVSLISLLAIWWGVLLVVGGGGAAELLWFGGLGVEDVFLKHVPTLGWAVLFLVFGAGLAIARLAKYLALERLLILLSSMVWAFTAASLFKLAPLSFSAGTYMLVTLFSAWAYWRVRYE